MINKVPYPDRRIFLYDDKVTSMVKEQHVTHRLDHIEYHPFIGSLIFIEGAEYPKKGFPTPEAVWAANQAKVVITEGMKVIYTPAFIIGFLFTWNKIKLIEKILVSYNLIAFRSLKPYLYKEIYMMPTCYTLNNLVLIFLTKIGIDQKIASDFSYLLAHIFEYDDAYRYRLQDIVSETTSDRLKHVSQMEIKRLMEIYLLRETGNSVQPRVKRIVNIITWALYIPKIKKAFQSMCDFPIERMALDEADRYWIGMRNDYNFEGLDYETRVSKLKKVPEQLIVNI